MATTHLLLQALCIKCMQGVNGGHPGIPDLLPTIFISELIMEFDKMRFHCHTI
jgi:hypothetical protein